MTSVSVAVSSVAQPGTQADREQVPAYIQKNLNTAKPVDIFRPSRSEWEAVYVRAIDFDSEGNARITILGQQSETVALSETQFRPYVAKRQ